MSDKDDTSLESEVEKIELTPDTIPDFAKKTGRSEQDLLERWAFAKAEDKRLYGVMLAYPWYLDEVIVGEWTQ
jgi:hypothetical protein